MKIKLLFAYVFIFSLLLFFYTFKYFFIKKEVVGLSKDHRNIEIGCLFLERKYMTKNGDVRFKVNIEGGSYLLSDIVVKEFPFYGQYPDFIKIIDEKTCYRIKYIKIKFFIYESKFVYKILD
ncbi:hypothetical protein [Acinetobacter venetianus]|uniref:hypothetical protein n=1 Tax=Acinetobacter venetianus TaxID=52133 RepID=UPI001022F636|nr:hypothetical protein [Acinetobacter venetianus]RZG79217.1 hypothetical protein EXE23_14320 [Acinetobacter venetianus]